MRHQGRIGSNFESMPDAEPSFPIFAFSDSFMNCAVGSDAPFV